MRKLFREGSSPGGMLNEKWETDYSHQSRETCDGLNGTQSCDHVHEHHDHDPMEEQDHRHGPTVADFIQSSGGDDDKDETYMDWD
jgi:hypothetical protein